MQEVERSRSQSRDLLDEPSPVGTGVDLFFCKSIYFRDPNGLYLEYSVTTLEYTEMKPFLEDPDPTMATRKVFREKMDEFKVKFREGHDFVDAGNRKP